MLAGFASISPIARFWAAESGFWLFGEKRALFGALEVLRRDLVMPRGRIALTTLESGQR